MGEPVVARPLVGRPIPRVEDARLLRGRGRFVADLSPTAGIHHAAIVRSPHAHARVLSVDAAAARALDGVLAVVTPDDARRLLRPFGVGVPGADPYWPLALDTARYAGEPVAVVVARDRYVAEDAADLVFVDYEPLDPVLDVERGRVVSARSFRYGEPDAAFAAAARTVEASFRFPRYSSTPVECYAVLAEWDDAAGEVTVWSNFHGPFVMQPLVAASLGIAENRLRLVVPPDIGGSFGIKSGVYAYIPLIALASRIAGVPVRWTADRWEDLVASQAGTARLTRAAAAVDGSGRITGLRLEILDDVGAHLRPPEPATLYRCFGNLVGPYAIEHLAVEARAVLTNRAPTGLNRGFGGQQLYFTVERLVEMVGRDAGLDAVEVRRRNLIPAERMPYRTPSGGVYDSGDYPGLLDALLREGDHAGLLAERDRLRAAGRLAGVGMALVVDPSGTNLGYIDLARTPDERARGLGKSGCIETATLTMDPMGAVRLRIATAPEGQGHETVAAQIVADELGIPMDQVRVDPSIDTAAQQWNVSSGSYSSRFAPITASAIQRSCAALRLRLCAIAAEMLEVDPADLELVDGTVRTRGTDRSVPLRRVAGLAHWDPGSLPRGVDPLLTVTASFSSELARGPAADDTVDSSICYGGVADLCLVDIDPETCEVRVLRYASVHDSGRILNPLLADGQVAGALAHGLGGALLEELVYDADGTPQTTSFMDYLCPSVREMPELRIHHLDGDTDFVPSGAKGIGEGNCMAAPAAIANAVTDALRAHGIEVNELPVHGGRIWEWLHKGER
ncbi:MAG TPA: xanthine dehydrogenase family protein molybdopterin-binding subunit [Candidatus Dormibacteraeota bacterium]|nr:xanthine dehydrogenase family protein molybdopterin-binding subunit [Candidatus Dormibacteraeota bacterium]